MKQYLFLAALLLQCFRAFSQPPADLYATILLQDSLLFGAGFNTCDIAHFEHMLSDSFEFYHDKDGISGKTGFIKALRAGLCGSPATYRSRRELVRESTQIYPLYKDQVIYGAVQSGSHRFYETLQNDKETYAGSARFTHLWLLENGTWKLSRSLSFDHRETDVANYRSAFFDNDSAVASWLKEIRVPVLGIGVIHNGALQQVKVFGELRPGVPAPYNTIFNVASLTKPVTALVTLRLVSAGKWDPDEPLYKYWTDPEVAQDPRHRLLTTRHVLSHQTGFRNWRRENSDGKLQFGFTPGTGYGYSGEGFEYLRKALEKKFRKTLDQLAAEYLFGPLKMTDTRYCWSGTADTQRLAQGYSPEGIPYKTVRNTTANAADDLFTTIPDYGSFLVSILNRQGISDPVFSDMIRPQVASSKGKYFGLGMEIYDLGNGEYALSHGGADEGCQAICFILPRTGQGIVIFTNVDDGYKVYEKILVHYLGDYGRKIVDIEMQ